MTDTHARLRPSRWLPVFLIWVAVPAPLYIWLIVSLLI